MVCREETPTSMQSRKKTGGVNASWRPGQANGTDRPYAGALLECGWPVAVPGRACGTSSQHRTRSVSLPARLYTSKYPREGLHPDGKLLPTSTTLADFFGMTGVDRIPKSDFL